MVLWVLLVWLAVGLMIGVMTRAMFKRKSSFGYIGDAILGGAGGVIGGYYMALSTVGSTLEGLLITIAVAALGAFLMVWTVKFITRP